MKPIVLVLLMLCVLIFHIPAHAEGNCPAGYYPLGGQGVQGCAPIPNYDQQQSSQTPVEPSPRWESRWGAIATDADKGVLGSAANMLQKEQAKQAALNDCKAKGGTDCGLAEWYSNGCAAMILGKKKYNVKAASTEQQAIQAAMKFCNATDANCRVYFTSCSQAVRIQ